MSAVVDEARARGVTRLCHVTKSVNLAHILETGEMLPTEKLHAAGRPFRPADPLRLDGAPGHSFLSVEYPNTWYLDQAAARDPHFREWVVLTLDLSLLSTPGARFSPYNSASDGSAGARSGPEGFRGMFAPSVTGRATFHRGPHHPPWWPTDDQAEVQLPGRVPLSAVLSVIVRSDEQAALERFRLTWNARAVSLPPLTVAPHLFDKRALSDAVRAGVRPPETPARVGGGPDPGAGA